MGVQEFYLYDNDSTDDWQRVLTPYIDQGTVLVTPWPSQPRNAQFTAYGHCLRHRRRQARRIAFLDIDEFLFSPTGKPLPQVLAELERHPGVIAAWRVYGTGGWKTRPPGFVTDSYLLRGSDDHYLNSFGKPIVDPRRTLSYVTSPHCFPHTSRKIWRLQPPVDEAGRPYSGRCSSANLLRINHYYSKSEAEALAKWRRGGVSRTDGMHSAPLNQFIDPSLNDVFDDAVAGFVADLRGEVVPSRTRRA
jgi:hypothetical protein